MYSKEYGCAVSGMRMGIQDGFIERQIPIPFVLDV